ncbi:hydrophobe/amphiphile efflux-1 (HAE1) family transporter [Enterobacter asburiae]|uniref:Hydrophobe/amphiphile efflux-1 (HAE1) family transporter n=1 Tax=Enterobacter asburiae TaxID=61645 RepID=A0A376FGT7_ENTAS|nr:hydrophobe/amphiphile efflux-1 (HAE1) family transporter [Enterobacter asburiae]
MFSRFFVRRPVFAWVIAILIMLAGMLAIRTLPVAQYPDVAPPSIKISATYTGASAQTLENSVTQVIEQQLTGLDNLLYFTSTSSSDGSVSITVTFEQGTRSGHRPGTGAEQGPAGGIAPADRGAAVRHYRREIAEQLPADHGRI